MNPQISITAVETPQVVGSVTLSEDFAAPVYNQVNQEQILTACSRAPVFEYMAPAPVTEHIAPVPAVTSDAHSQQLPPVYTTTTVTADDNLDIIGLVYPQFSSIAVEPFSPQVVGFLSRVEEFDAPVYKQIHQEQIVAGMTTQHRIENPAVQDQVIVQEIPEVVEGIQERILDPIEVLPHEHVQQQSALQIVHMPVPQIQKSSAVPDLVNPQSSTTSLEASQVQVAERIQEQIVEAIDVTPQASQMALNTSSTSTSSSAPVCNQIPCSSNDRLGALANLLDSCIEQLTPFASQIESIEKATERASMLAKRMMETPLPEPPRREPPLVEPDRTSANRRRRTRYTPLPRSRLRDAPNCARYDTAHRK